MLDKRSEILLMTIVKQCQNGSFQVIEINDLISCMPRKYKADTNLIYQCVSALEREGYIDVKYHDSEVFCLSPLPKARVVFENKIEKHSNKKKLLSIVIASVFSLIVLLILTSFCGAYIFSKVVR